MIGNSLLGYCRYGLRMRTINRRGTCARRGLNGKPRAAERATWICDVLWSAGEPLSSLCSTCTIGE